MLFLLIGTAQLLQRKRLSVEKPKWIVELESATPRTSFILGLLLANLNPNLFIMLSGMSVIASSDFTGTQALLGAVLLLVAAMLDFLGPTAIYLTLGDRARRGLDTTKAWMISRNKELGVAVFLSFGLLFTIRGAAALL